MTKPTGFEREDRYIVMKKSRLTEAQLDALLGLMLPSVSAVVVERDWPEYEPVWGMIEQRCEASA